MGDTRIRTYLAYLHSCSKDELVNMLYNRRIEDYADYSDYDKKQGKDTRGTGKRIPYIGWFWRNTDFVGKRISIGNTGEMIGVMENNKWDYPERDMTPEEVDTFIAFIERALAAWGKGGSVSQLEEDVEKVWNELWDWFQTLVVE